MRKKITKKEQKEIDVARIGLVATYLLDTSPYYYDMAKDDAQNLFDTNKKEFLRTLKYAQNLAKQNEI